MTPPYEITTPRLRLHAPSRDEIRDEMHARIHDERPDLGTRIGATIPVEWPGPRLLASMPQLAQEMTLEQGDARWVWMVIEQASACVIGDIGFHGPLHDEATVEIGYVLLPHARGHGYATEATSAVIEWTFAYTKVAQIIAQIDPANAASLRVAAKLGMRELPPISEEYACFGISRPPA